MQGHREKNGSLDLLSGSFEERLKHSELLKTLLSLYAHIFPVSKCCYWLGSSSIESTQDFAGCFLGIAFCGM